ncbi:MAG: hypothetical protein AAF607_09200 [Pseudomonadota bacterium]
MRFTDADGAENIIGLVKMKVTPAPEPSALAGSVVSVEILGVGAVVTEDRSFFALGYSKDKIAGIRDHSVVCGNPVEAIDDPASPSDGSCSIIGGDLGAENTLYQSSRGVADSLRNE